MIWFATATLIPVALLTLAALMGGVWAAAALLYVTAFTYGMDRLVTRAAVVLGSDDEFPSGDRLSVALGLAHLALMPLAVWAIGGPSDLGAAERIACFVAFGQFFGQVSNSNAHELIHRSNRWMRRLGTSVYVSMLFGHHTSSHVRVHHVHVGSDGDPNSPNPGESFYAFAPRAWIGSFRQGFAAENALRDRAADRSSLGLHPYVFYVGGALACIFVAVSWLGAPGLLVFMVLSIYAQMQLLLSDYVQHYGLRRRVLPNGKLEPIGPAHSWNAPHFYSSALMLNAPRHSDHHVRPTRAYPELQLTDDMPVLPRSLPVMATVALVPFVWRRMMDPKIAYMDRVGKASPSPAE